MRAVTPKYEAPYLGWNTRHRNCFLSQVSPKLARNNSNCINGHHSLRLQRKYKFRGDSFVSKSGRIVLYNKDSLSKLTEHSAASDIVLEWHGSYEELVEAALHLSAFSWFNSTVAIKIRTSCVVDWQLMTFLGNSRLQSFELQCTSFQNGASGQWDGYKQLKRVKLKLVDVCEYDCSGSFNDFTKGLPKTLDTLELDNATPFDVNFDGVPRHCGISTVIVRGAIVKNLGNCPHGTYVKCRVDVEPTSDSGYDLVDYSLLPGVWGRELKGSWLSVRAELCTEAFLQPAVVYLALPILFWAFILYSENAILFGGS